MINGFIYGCNKLDPHSLAKRLLLTILVNPWQRHGKLAKLNLAPRVVYEKRTDALDGSEAGNVFGEGKVLSSMKLALIRATAAIVRGRFLYWSRH